jgi:signal transduction histidine kinase
MKLRYAALNIISGILMLCSLTILRGGNSVETPVKMPIRDSLAKVVADKSVWDILAFSSAYSFADLPVAIAYCEVALDKAQKNKNTEDIFNAYRGLGFVYEDNRLFDKAQNAYINAETTSKSLPDSFKTTIYNDLAILNRKANNFKISYNYYERLLELAQKSNDQVMVASAYHGEAQMHREIGNYDNAVVLFLKSLSISQEIQAQLDIISSHIDIAETYRQAKELEKAKSHIEKAFLLVKEELKKTPNDVEYNAKIASVLKTHGNILADLKRYDEALEKYQSALTIYRNISQKIQIARTLQAIANLYISKNKFVEAENKFNECLKYEDQFLERDKANLHLSLGMFYGLQHRNSEATQAFQKCLDISNAKELRELAQKANYQLFLIYLDQHKNELALKHLTQYNTLHDSLFNEEKIRRTAEYEFKYDTERREKEFASVKASQDRFLLVLLISASLMVFLFLAYTVQMRGRSVRQMRLKNEEIQAQYRRLEESNEILSQFAYVAAHDLKEPLRSIGSYVGLIQMKYGKDLPPDAKEYMQFVNAGVKRMYSLLTDLLDFSQVIAQQPGAEVVRPDDVLADVKANLRTAIESKNAVIESSAEFPSIRINRMHLLQLFQNLIGNALKFTSEQPVVKVEGKEENGRVLLTIEDNGIGIKPEFSNKVFVLFQQLNKKGQFDGTGIGLTICKNIVEKYNGKIWFESEENKGTKFYISIPANAA